MDDFSKYLSKNKPFKAIPVPNEYGGIYDKPKAPAQPKVGFIRARLNRDNLWNLIFWLGMVLGMAIVDFFASFIPILALASFILSLTLVPIFLVKMNRVTWTENKILVNKSGESLETRYPRGFAYIVILSLPFSIQSFFAVHEHFPLMKDSMVVYTAIALFLPTLYFIYKNCPISILFNKNAWTKEVMGIAKDQITYGNFNSFGSSGFHHSKRNNDLYHTPGYSSLSGNIYHHHHRR